MNLREKYGEWGIILGATEGVGKAFCEKLAQGGMSVVMVGRREQMLNDLGAELKAKYGTGCKVVRADLSLPDAMDTVFAATEGLDMGFSPMWPAFIPSGRSRTRHGRSMRPCSTST